MNHLRSFVLAWLAVFAAWDPAQAEPAPGAAARLAATPPMGWNSWNRFGCKIDEAVIRREADAMVDSGLAGAGYAYVIVDDCWHGERDAHGDIQPDPKRFPSGIKALADYVHAKGLKFGLYSDAGDRTCAERPGSRGHEFQDAAQYAAWGVDYLKYDWCNTGTEDARAAYTTMAKAIHAAGRPMVLSICDWGVSKPWLWAGEVGQLWRTANDIIDSWGPRPTATGSDPGMIDLVDKQVGLDAFAGPGRWNDPDMLEVGNGGMTDTEYRAHFSLWAMLAAPLIAGNDLSTMTPETRAILTNREVIAVDQDGLGVEGKRVAKDGDFEVWARPLKGGGRAVILLNRATASHEIRVDWEALGYPGRLGAQVRDLWAHKDLQRAVGAFSARVPAHGAVMVRIQP